MSQLLRALSGRLLAGDPAVGRRGARILVPLLALAAHAAAAGPAQARQALHELRPALESRIAEHAGSVALAAIDLRSGEKLSLAGDEPFPAASLIKVPILVEVYQRLEDGELSPDDPLVMLEVDRQPGSGVLRHLAAPHTLTVADAAVLMIVLSDNTATNLLIDKVGIRSVGARMEALGLPRTKLHSKTFLRETSVEPDSSARYGLGVTTAAELAELLAMLYRGEVVTADASRAMLDVLSQQFYAEGIPRGLPPGTRVAHKTGALTRARHDCGIVYSPALDFVLCVLTRENADERWTVDNEAHLLARDVARLVYDGLVDPAAADG